MGVSDVPELRLINESDLYSSVMDIKNFPARHPNISSSKSDTDTPLSRNPPLVSSGVPETCVQVTLPTPVTKYQVTAPTSKVVSDKPRRPSKVTSQVGKGKLLTVASLKTPSK